MQTTHPAKLFVTELLQRERQRKQPSSHGCSVGNLKLLKSGMFPASRFLVPNTGLLIACTSIHPGYHRRPSSGTGRLADGQTGRLAGPLRYCATGNSQSQSDLRLGSKSFSCCGNKPDNHS